MRLIKYRKHALAIAGANSERLYRLLRFATAHSIFTASFPSGRQHGPETTVFCNNRLSACLREDHPNCQRHVVSVLVLVIDARGFSVTASGYVFSGVQSSMNDQEQEGLRTQFPIHKAFGSDFESQDS